MDKKRHSFPVSVAPTEYHSFHNVEMLESTTPPQTRHSHQQEPIRVSRTSLHKQQFDANGKDKRRPSTGTKMQRQDSGYESISSPRTSLSQGRPVVYRRSSNSSSVAASFSRARKRPSIQRVAKANSYYGGRTSNQSLHLVGANPSPTQPVTYFHFPPPDPIELTERATSSPIPIPSLPTTAKETVEEASSEMPPQTTHYWTSDRTRRLEYAAIDAATRGVRGWVMRNLVPECFVPKGNRQHVPFDDDTGSVRRYRLELEDEGEEKTTSTKKEGRRRKGWSLWGRKSNAMAA